MMSVAPPGAYGTMIFTVRLGHWSAFCAAAGSAENASVANIATPHNANRAARGEHLTQPKRATANWTMLPPCRLAQVDRTCAIVARGILVFLYREHHSAIRPWK